MEIALIAHSGKKELLAQFCIAYYTILKNHHLCAPAATAQYVADAAGLEIERYMLSEFGGDQQIASKISCNEIDCLIYFRETSEYKAPDRDSSDLLRLCDIRCIPFATNLATAEILIRAIEVGDLDWREYENPVGRP